MQQGFGATAAVILVAEHSRMVAERSRSIAVFLIFFVGFGKKYYFCG